MTTHMPLLPERERHQLLSVIGSLATVETILLPSLV